MDTQTISKFIKGVIVNTCYLKDDKAKKIMGHTNLREDIDISSIEIMEMITYIEDEYDIDIDENEFIKKIITLDDAVNYVHDVIMN